MVDHGSMILFYSKCLMVLYEVRAKQIRFEYNCALNAGYNAYHLFTVLLIQLFAVKDENDCQKLKVC